MLVSWVLLALGASSVIVLIVGIVVLDLGVQGTQISNQSAIYPLASGRAQPRSRPPTWSAYFLGGTVCSAVTGALYAVRRLVGRLRLRRSPSACRRGRDLRRSPRPRVRTGLPSAA